MLTFLITTSTKLASISLFEDDNMLSNININVRRSHSTTILDQVKKLFEWSSKDINDVNNVVISKGPGSFTGVRIAMSLVKGIFALDDSAKFYSVSELEAIYYNAKMYADVVVSGIDSRKGKVYYNIYNKGEKIVDDAIGNIDKIVEYVQNIDSSIIFAGDIAINYAENIKHPKLVKVPLIKLGIDTKIYYDMFKNGYAKKEDLKTLEPYYLEKSQAEKDYKGE